MPDDQSTVTVAPVAVLETTPDVNCPPTCVEVIYALMVEVLVGDSEPTIRLVRRIFPIVPETNIVPKAKLALPMFDELLALGKKFPAMKMLDEALILLETVRTEPTEDEALD